MNTQKLIELFAADISARNANTARNYVKAVRSCLVEYEIALDENVLVNLYKHMNAANFSTRTRENRLAVMRQFLAWAEGEELISFSCVKAVQRLKRVIGGTRSVYVPRMPDKDIAKLRTFYDACDHDEKQTARTVRLRNAAILHLLFSSAMRIGELRRLDRVDVRGDEIFIKLSKGGKSRTVFADKLAREAMSNYLAARLDDLPALFLAGRRRIHTNTIYDVVKDAAKKLDLAPNTSPHMIRHYVATRMMNEADVPLEVVQKILGHASPATTEMIYAHARLSQVRRHVARYFESA